MNVEVVDYLRLVEAANKVLYFDLETQGLTADYGKILVYSRKFNKDSKCLSVTGTEKQILKQMNLDFAEADLLVSYNGRMFDVPYANTRLLELQKPPLPRKHHLDMYFALKYKLRTTSKAMGSVGTLLGLDEDKMKVPPQAWRNKDIPTLVARCESDVKLLQEVYERAKHLVRSISLG